MTYSIEENHHSGLELYFMPRFFVSIILVVRSLIPMSSTKFSVSKM